MSNYISVTESESNHDGLDTMSTRQLLRGMNEEDKSVPVAIDKAIPQIEELIENIFPKMAHNKGRLFYIGAGTSGRLGIVDASECPPTYGVDQGVVVGIIAGGDGAIRQAVEYAEDNPELSVTDLKGYNLCADDSILGIAASGRTPYVIGGIDYARRLGCVTGCITCNPGSPVSLACEFPIEVKVGPEFVTGSTRMKAGTAQKLVLNMISTSLMIKLGHVKGNRMVDMALSNIKLVERGVNMVILQLKKEKASDIQDNVIDSLDRVKLEKLLLEKGSVRATVDTMKANSYVL